MYNFYTDMASVASWTIPNPSTVCLWFIPRGYNASYNYLIGTADNWCARYNISTTKIEARFNQNNSLASTSTLNVGARAHLVFTIQRSSVGKLYFNGAEEGDNSGSSTPTSPATLAIGGRGGLSSDYANGDIEDVRIYNRLLSPAEIKNIYLSGGRDVITSGLINQWARTSLGNGTEISTDSIYDETTSRQHLTKAGAGNIYYRGGFLNPRRRV